MRHDLRWMSCAATLLLAGAARADDELAPLATLPRDAPRPTAEPWLLPHVRGGVLVPLSGLQAGPSVAGGVELRLARRLRLGLTAGYEAHLGTQAATFLAAGQPRGFDGAALSAQQLVPLALSAAVELLHTERGALLLGVEGALLVVTTRVHALGVDTTESGLGANVAGELGYAHRLGPLETSLRARWTVRRTAVGPRTEAVELPWYQALGVSLAVAWPL